MQVPSANLRTIAHLNLVATVQRALLLRTVTLASVPRASPVSNAPTMLWSARWSRVNTENATTRMAATRKCYQYGRSFFRRRTVFNIDLIAHVIRVTEPRRKLHVFARSSV